MHLTQRTILITGGSTGIGHALAQNLMQRGNTVIAVARNPQRLEKAARESKPPKTRSHKPIVTAGMA